MLLTTIQDNQTIIIISIADDDRNLEEVRKKIKFTPDYKASEPVFWRVFKELANEKNNGLVSYYNLQERLISTGKLDAGGSVLMIGHMEKAGKIEKTEGYNIYKIGKSVATKEEDAPMICT